MTKIHYTKPSITQLEIDYVSDAIKNGWGANCYDYIKRFEKSFANFLNAPKVVATSSCTGALHIALASMGIKPGDEVIVPDINWIASAAPVTYLGATPVCVDVLEDTWCIDPEKVLQAVTPNTKAVIAVHLYGNLCEMDELKKICKDHSLFLIEDAAEAIGSRYNGKMAGSIGDLACFSFHGTKTFTTGEGGALVVNNERFAEHIDTLANHGRRADADKMFWCDNIGFKYKMSNLQAAIGCAQIERADFLINRKREIFHSYSRHLPEGKFAMNPEKINTLNSYWMPTVIMPQVDEQIRDQIMDKLNHLGIDARPFFYPLTLQGNKRLFRRFSENPISYSIYAKGMNLPSYVDMSDEQVKLVCHELIKAVDYYS